jgi:acetylornithine deacetylase/succinyl-diaminopimelate desuccinylase-like protein
MHKQQMLEFFGHRQEEVLKLIKTLVDIESPSRDVAGSGAATNFLEQQARKLRCVTKIERISAEN